MPQDTAVAEPPVQTGGQAAPQGTPAPSKPASGIPKQVADEFSKAFGVAIRESEAEVANPQEAEPEVPATAGDAPAEATVVAPADKGEQTGQDEEQVEIPDKLPGDELLAGKSVV